MGAVTGIWVVFVFLVLLNGFAAGMAAVLHVWRSGQRRRSRIVTAAALTGLVPTVMIFPAVFEQELAGGAQLAGMIVGMGMMFGLSTVVSLPGAVIIGRRLDGPGDAYRTFE